MRAAEPAAACFPVSPKGPLPVLCSRSLTTMRRAIFTGGAVSGICSESDRISTTCTGLDQP